MKKKVPQSSATAGGALIGRNSSGTMFRVSSASSSKRSLMFKILTFVCLIWLIAIIYMLGCIDRSRLGCFNSSSSYWHFTSDHKLPSGAFLPVQRKTNLATLSRHLLQRKTNPPKSSSSVDDEAQISPLVARNLMQSVAIAKRRIAAKTNELRFLLHTVNNLSSSNSGGRYSHAETLQALEELTDVLTNDLDVMKTPAASSLDVVESFSAAASTLTTTTQLSEEEETELDVEIDQKSDTTSDDENSFAAVQIPNNIEVDDFSKSEPLMARRRRRKRRKAHKPVFSLQNSEMPENSSKFLAESFDSVAQDAKNLMREVQSRLYTLQNPVDGCLQGSKTVVCKLNKGCGFGCQIHHVNYCLIMAYALNRTLLLDDRHWRYSRHGWIAAFRPLSHTCEFNNLTVASLQPTSSKRRQLASAAGSSTLSVLSNQNYTNLLQQNITYAFPHTSSSNTITAVDWRSVYSATKNHDDLRRAQQINLPIIDALRPKPAFVPPAVPADLATRILAIHAQPFIWWIGQIMWFLWQLDRARAEELEALMRRYKFNQSPIVGIHIRRTDKIGVEAALHSTDEYMKAAGEYFDRLDNIQRRRLKTVNATTAVDVGRKTIPRRAFVATDDASVLRDLRKRYQNWQILGDEQTAQSAAVSRRNSDASLAGIVRDIELLSRTDFIVCTFSSQVCRVAYELMQARQTAVYGRDASESVRSLDDIYYYGGQNQRDWQVIVAHRARNAREIDLDLNDLVGVAGNHWDGLSYGINRRTQRKGLFPSFKVVEKVLAVEMPAKDYV